MTRTKKAPALAKAVEEIMDEIEAPAPPVKTKAQIEAEEWRERVDMLVAAVKAHASEHYEEGGWDVVVETMDDKAIEDEVYRCRTPEGAIRKIGDIVGAYDSYRSDIIASGDPQPKKAGAAEEYEAGDLATCHECFRMVHHEQINPETGICLDCTTKGEAG
jgi:hypothetical protein